MNFRDANNGSGEAKYISKRVMINGQFVTLYSLNGQTWLSSPEDIPALMERLENARVTLNPSEKLAEGEDPKVAPPEGAKAGNPKEAKKPEAEAAPDRALAMKYRVKGPKPRPILRQDGVVIKGTPIEPISASGTVVSFSSDVSSEVSKARGEKSAKVTLGTKERAAKLKEVKLIAPVISKRKQEVTKTTKATTTNNNTKTTKAVKATQVAKVSVLKNETLKAKEAQAKLNSSKKTAKAPVSNQPVKGSKTSVKAKRGVSAKSNPGAKVKRFGARDKVSAHKKATSRGKRSGK